MTRLVVVSATPSLAMGLAGAKYRTTVLGPSELGRGPIPPADVLVVDQDDTLQALDLLRSLRAADIRCPVLLLGADADEVAASGLQSVAVLAKPVTRPALLQAVDHTARLRPAPRVQEAAGARSTEQPPASQPTAAPAVEPAAGEPGQQPNTVVDLREALPAPAASESAPPGSDGTAEGPARLPEAVMLARRLTPLAETLYGVRETAQAVVEDAMERVPAGRGGLLVPDDREWRVAGAVRLRQSDLDLLVPADAWIVRAVGVTGKGLLIDDTDVVRPQLRGTPLASARHLVAVPIGADGSVLLLGRDEAPAFTEEDLAALMAVSAEAADLLAWAVESRALARALAPLRDPRPERTSRSPVSPGLD